MHRKTPKFSWGSAPKPRACAAGAGTSPQTQMLPPERYAPVRVGVAWAEHEPVDVRERARPRAHCCGWRASENGRRSYRYARCAQVRTTNNKEWEEV